MAARRVILLFVATLLSGCASWLVPEATVPMRQVNVHLARADIRPATLFFILPGRGDTPEQIADGNLVDALREQGVHCRVIIPDAHLGYYYGKTVTDRLHSDVLAPLASAFPQSPRRAVGVSLGGLGALFTQRDYPGSFERVYLIAPYLGESPALLKSLQAAPSLAAWTPPPGLDAEEHEIELWTLLAAHARGEVDLGELWLLYGENDRFHDFQDILASSLPVDRVLTAPGGHAWAVWDPLWRQAISKEQGPSR